MNGELKILIALLALIVFWGLCIAITIWAVKDDTPEEPMTQEQLEAELMLILTLAPIFAFLIVFSCVAQFFGRILRRKGDEG